MWLALARVLMLRREMTWRSGIGRRRLYIAGTGKWQKLGYDVKGILDISLILLSWGSMSTGSPMITLRRVAVCTMVSLWLAGCTNNASTSAPISSVGGGGAVPSGNNNGGAQQVSPRAVLSITAVITLSLKGATAAVKPIRSSAATRCFISPGSPATISATWRSVTIFPSHTA